MRTVAASWADIDGWLAAHAPAGARLLAGPATDDALAGGQRGTGLGWPPELLESLRCHDGMTAWGNLLPTGVLLSAGQIVEHYAERMAEIAAEGGADLSGEEPWWHPRWLPFADADGDLDVIDLRPGPHLGRVGIAGHDGRGDFGGGLLGLAHYLDQVADALLVGRSSFELEPYLLGEELWWDRPHAVEVNGEPLRPAPR